MAIRNADELTMAVLAEMDSMARGVVVPALVTKVKRNQPSAGMDCPGSRLARTMILVAWSSTNTRMAMLKNIRSRFRRGPLGRAAPVGEVMAWYECSMPHRGPRSRTPHVHSPLLSLLYLT